MTVTHRPLRVGISACLLGHRVRYDGEVRPHPLADWLEAEGCQLMPVCPEVEMGMPVPREPIQIEVAPDGGLELVGVQSRQSHTAGFQAWASARLGDTDPSRALEGVDVYVTRARSPSCGAGSTPWFEAGGTASTLGDGLFVAALRKAFPRLVIVEDTALADASAVRALLETARARQRADGEGSEGRGDLEGPVGSAWKDGDFR